MNRGGLAGELEGDPYPSVEVIRYDGQQAELIGSTGEESALTATRGWPSRRHVWFGVAPALPEADGFYGEMERPGWR